MGQRRPWLPEEDKLIFKFIAQNETKNAAHKMKWIQMADQINNQIKGSKRTGKQCRERWHNQLDPKIKHNEEWTNRQITQLLIQQRKFGNKWAEIAKHLPGRTDNNVKNYFYSTLRRGVRRINAYIVYLRRKKILKKQFNQNVLSKILAVADGKSKNKLSIKKQDLAMNLARKIRDQLIRLAHDEKDESNLNDKDEQNCQRKNQIIEDIMQFNRNCKRKKTKHKNQDEQNDEECQYENQRDEQQQKFFSQKVEQVPQQEQQKQLQQKKIQNQKTSKKRKGIILLEQSILNNLKPNSKRNHINQENSQDNKIKVQRYRKNERRNPNQNVKKQQSINLSNSFNKLSSNLNRSSSSFKKYIIEDQLAKSQKKTKRITKDKKTNKYNRKQKFAEKPLTRQNSIVIENKDKNIGIQRKTSNLSFNIENQSQRLFRKPTLNNNQSITFSKLIDDPHPSFPKHQFNSKAVQGSGFLKNLPITRRNSILGNKFGSFDNNIDIPFDAVPNFSEMLQSMQFPPQKAESFDPNKSLDLFGLKSGQIDVPRIGLKREASLLGLSSSINYNNANNQKQKIEGRPLTRRQSYLLKSNDSFGRKKN